MVARETFSFVFLRVLTFPVTKSRETLGLEGKLVSQATIHWALCYIFRLSLKQSYSNNNKQRWHKVFIHNRQSCWMTCICFEVQEKVIANIMLLLHIICGYQCDKAVNKNDTCEMIWYHDHFTEWNDIISLHEFELSNQTDCNNLAGPIGFHVIF